MSYYVKTKKKSAIKMLPTVSPELGPLPFQFDAYPTELTWNVPVKGSLNCLFFMHHLILGLR